VDRSFERTFGGLGIGLTLVKRLVEMHGGIVEARSDGPATGAEFIVRLPAAGGGARAGGDDRGSARLTASTTARRILVADDNKDAAECLADALRLMGHEVQTVHDGLSAVNVAESRRPELVLLDLGMPQMDGYEAARRIRAALGRRVFIAAVTGWGQIEDQQRSRDAGFDRHLIKPIDLSELAGLIEVLAPRAV
jgi:CheY-like chemotaxis protein